MSEGGALERMQRDIEELKLYVSELEGRIKTLEKRIHNQRVALRENWMIVEMRRNEYCGNLRPLKSKWWDHVKKQHVKIKELQDEIESIKLEKKA